MFFCIKLKSGVLLLISCLKILFFIILHHLYDGKAYTINNFKNRNNYESKKNLFLPRHDPRTGNRSNDYYLMTQPEEQVSDLTLANIEAMAIMIDGKENTPVKLPCRYTGYEFDHCSIIVETTDGRTKEEGWDGFVNEEEKNLN